MSQMTYAEAINEALHEAMQLDSSVICYGLGVTDPKAVFGTTSNLEKKFGTERVFDMPTSRGVFGDQLVSIFILSLLETLNNASPFLKSRYSLP